MNEEPPQKLSILSELTNTEPEEWEPTNGPDSGMGIDTYYLNTSTNQEVWINEEQDYITIACDGITLYEGYVAQLEEDLEKDLDEESSYD